MSLYVVADSGPWRAHLFASQKAIKFPPKVYPKTKSWTPVLPEGMGDIIGTGGSKSHEHARLQEAGMHSRGILSLKLYQEAWWHHPCLLEASGARVEFFFCVCLIGYLCWGGQKSGKKIDLQFAMEGCLYNWIDGLDAANLNTWKRVVSILILHRMEKSKSSCGHFAVTSACYIDLPVCVTCINIVSTSFKHCNNTTHYNTASTCTGLAEEFA